MESLKIIPDVKIFVNSEGWFAALVGDVEVIAELRDGCEVKNGAVVIFDKNGNPTRAIFAPAIS